MFKYLLKRFCIKMKCKGGFFWMIPAAMAAAGAIKGAVKHKQDKDQYSKDIDERNRINMFSAFTGKKTTGAKPEKPDAFNTVLGGGLAGAKIGMGIGNAIENPYFSGASTQTTPKVSSGGGQIMGNAANAPMPSYGQQVMLPMNPYGNMVMNTQGQTSLNPYILRG